MQTTDDSRPFALENNRYGRFELGKGRSRIGRSKENDHVLADRSVSQRHAAIQVRTEEIVIEDLTSRNGIFVNGERVTKASAREGDEVRLGRVSFELIRVDPGDTLLAIRSSTGHQENTRSTPDLSTVATFSSVAAEDAGRWLRLVNEILELAGGRRTGEAIGRLVDELPATGALALEISDSASVIARQSWGNAHEVLPTTVIESLCSQVRDDPTLQEAIFRKRTRDGAFVSVATHAHGSGVLAFVVPGLWHTHPTKSWLLRIGLQILRVSVEDQDGMNRRQRPAGKTQLTFPEEHVECPSHTMQALYAQLVIAAPSELPVLVLGETGVGKESVARILHLSSPRADGPFIAVNCAALPRDLLEAELFGVARGAATGVSERIGKFEAANGGILLLDEIGEMDSTLQAKILRVLEERSVEPLGGDSRRLDIRVVSSTNSDLEGAVEHGSFRKDLYYRLAGFVVEVPTLSDRQADIATLAEAFFRSACIESQRSVTGITYSALRILVNKRWGGNARELQHAITRAVHSCAVGKPINRRLLTSLGLAEQQGERVDDADPLTEHLPSLDLEEVEALIVKEALRRANSNQSDAAKLLGISRSALRRRLDKHGLLLDRR